MSPSGQFQTSLVKYLLSLFLPEFIFKKSSSDKSIHVYSMSAVFKCPSGLLTPQDSWHFQQTLMNNCITAWSEVSEACIRVNRALIITTSASHLQARFQFHTQASHRQGHYRQGLGQLYRILPSMDVLNQ